MSAAAVVWLVWDYYPHEDNELIGVYGSRSSALAAALETMKRCKATDLPQVDNCETGGVRFGKIDKHGCATGRMITVEPWEVEP